jgi:hypothetical protein
LEKNHTCCEPHLLRALQIISSGSYGQTISERESGGLPIVFAVVFSLEVVAFAIFRAASMFGPGSRRAIWAIWRTMGSDDVAGDGGLPRTEWTIETGAIGIEKVEGLADLFNLFLRKAGPFVSSVSAFGGAAHGK